MIYKPALMEIKVGFLSRLEKENDSELKSKVSIELGLLARDDLTTQELSVERFELQRVCWRISR